MTTTITDQQMKTCARCLNTKPLSEFRYTGNPYYNPSTIHCLECRTRYTSTELAKNKSLSRTYGLTELGWEFICALQAYNCAICDEHMPGKMCMDHDHSTGERRGMLCDRCNVLLDHPLTQRTPEMLGYLDRFTTTTTTTTTP